MQPRQLRPSPQKLPQCSIEFLGTARLLFPMAIGIEVAGPLLVEFAFSPSGDGFQHAAVFGRHRFNVLSDAVFHNQPDGAAFECRCGTR